tara:strand:- start:7755 stop:8072 length:318 start_codon:yes stop_codon:yes gene_type:complete
VIKATLVFTEIGGGECDFSLDLEMACLPSIGDWIQVRRPDSDGTEDFIVRRIRWNVLAANKTSLSDVLLECHYAVTETSTEQHRELHDASAENAGEKNVIPHSFF